MSNPYESKGRRKKAELIVAAIREREGTAADALRLTELGWEVVAKLAGVKLPSTETREMVVQILGES
jgi:hypothetical protein